MVNTLTQAGTASATWLHVPRAIDPESPTIADPADSYLSVADWSGLPNGTRLKAILNKSYASLATFVDAWATEGGSVGRTVMDSFVDSPVWFLDGEGYPKLYCFSVSGESPTIQQLSGIIRLSLSYSASA